ncbi:MAG: small multi-drug export protein [Sulfuriferula multivorans]|uniref:Small multi-drug export protein n=1 Tax=Sulfuriferula multivorans TaxID=1559896 RepID=A0A7C9TDH7_9PROT|nr:small multi-drug export protein [Sulfuriferula multivorans]
MSKSLFASPEGWILGIGLTLVSLLFLGLGIGWHLFPDSVLTYAAMTGLNLTIGRAAGMTFGYASGLGHAQVVPLNMLLQTIQVLVVYPLFVLSSRQLIRVPRLQSFLTRMQRAAETHGGTVRKFGIVGLFVFVFVPFWMTGPVVGSIIGFLIGLRPWVNIVTVLGATYVAIGVWALLLNELSAWAATVNHFAPYVLVVAIALIVVAMQWLARRRDRETAEGH